MRFNGYYVMESDGTIREESSLMDWAKWYGSADRKICRDEIGGATVSTVFLGIDHQFGDGQPVLFETMVFGGTLDGEQERYYTREEAVAGHEIIVAKVKQ